MTNSGHGIFKLFVTNTGHDKRRTRMIVTKSGHDKQRTRQTMDMEQITDA